MTGAGATGDRSGQPDKPPDRHATQSPQEPTQRRITARPPSQPPGPEWRSQRSIALYSAVTKKSQGPRHLPGVGAYWNTSACGSFLKYYFTNTTKPLEKPLNYEYYRVYRVGNYEYYRVYMVKIICFFLSNVTTSNYIVKTGQFRQKGGRHMPCISDDETQQLRARITTRMSLAEAARRAGFQESYLRQAMRRGRVLHKAKRLMDLVIAEHDAGASAKKRAGT